MENNAVEKITLSSISIDLEICPDNTLDVWLSTDGSSGAHYTGLSAADVATNVQELIECMAEAYLEGTGRKLATTASKENAESEELKMDYKKYIQEQEAAARDAFQNHKATVVQSDENFLILDWRNVSGSGEHFVRYILDIERGMLVISGDLGSCVACWYNRVHPDDLADYLKDISYFMSKFQCSSDTYCYSTDAIEEDLDEIKKSYLDDIDAGDLDAKAEIEDDFDEMFDALDECDLGPYTEYPDDLTELFCKYDQDWYDSEFARVGQRISPRVILWAVGYRMAMQQLKNRN